jgi:hypothetical protein
MRGTVSANDNREKLLQIELEPQMQMQMQMQTQMQKQKQRPWCNMRLNAVRSVEEAIDTLPLTPIQISILNLRFLSLLREYRGRSIYYSYSFNTLRIIISIGSLIVPALLSVQYTPGTTQSGDNSSQANMEMYWIVWTLSLLVTISNAIIALLKVDKKYYTLNTTYQHLLSEGWQYIELSGKYSGFFLPSEPSSHQNQFIFFCNVLEKIRMRNVQDEFYKVDDHSPSGGKGDPLVPPTPLKTLPFELTDVTVEKSNVLVNGGEETPSLTGTTVRKQNTPTAIASAFTANAAPLAQSAAGSRVYESP